MRIVLFVLLVLFSQMGCVDRWPEETFDSETWKALPWQEHYRMCRRLLDSGVLEGATRDRVIELLGEADGTVQIDRISYVLGQLEIFGRTVWVNVLEVRFDADGRVSRALVRRSRISGD